MIAEQPRLGLGMGGHHLPHRGLTDDWITPPEILGALGAFDLDPCACEQQPWATAATSYAPPQDGLGLPWTGRVWLNPPYGPLAARWLERLAAHGDGIALIFARTETAMFFEHVWRQAQAVLFLRGRLFFHRPDGKRAEHNAGAPSCLVAYGLRNQNALQESGLAGQLVRL